MSELDVPAYHSYLGVVVYRRERQEGVELKPPVTYCYLSRNMLRYPLRVQGAHMHAHICACTHTVTHTTTHMRPHLHTVDFGCV